jgi:UDP-glucose 4-epimerase
MSVYGDHPDRPVPEDAVATPKSFYGVGKVASENYMRIYQQYGIKAIALRLFNVYGPGQNMKNLRQGMVSIFLAQAIKDKHIHVKGSKDRYRDFIYIDDVVDAFLLFLDKKSDRGFFEVFNISTGVRTTIEQLIEHFKNKLPFEISIKYEGSTPGDQFGIVGDPSKIIAMHAWKARFSLEKGLSEFVHWALKNTKDFL